MSDNDSEYGLSLRATNEEGKICDLNLMSSYVFESHMSHTKQLANFQNPKNKSNQNQPFIIQAQHSPTLNRTSHVKPQSGPSSPVYFIKISRGD